ncbi:hypothetical protein TruAng_004017 [Truncatella angustata]|nr:hypothetical protein TruAng_004017 [Truncatella angustata]
MHFTAALLAFLSESAIAMPDTYLDAESEAAVEVWAAEDSIINASAACLHTMARNFKWKIRRLQSRCKYDYFAEWKFGIDNGQRDSVKCHSNV